MNFETLKNKSETLVFRESVASGGSGYLDLPLLDHGMVEKVRIRFATGENGTLRIRPVVILPGQIQIDLLRYASNPYVTGDSETIESDVRVEVENKAVARVYYENTSVDPLADDSIVNVDIGVTYFSVREPENIIGPRSSKWGLI